MGPFNNCSPVGGSNAEGSDSSQKSVVAGTGGGYNGTGFSGKATFLHYAAQPQCAQNTGQPEGVIDFLATQILYSKNICSTSTTQSISQSQIFMNPYDPYYLVFKDAVFIDQNIILPPSPGHRYVAYAFCYNPQYKNNVYGSVGVDFAVRIESIFNNGWQATIIGHAIYGHGSSAPYEEEVPGRLPDPVNGQESPFVAIAGKYRLDFGTKVSPTRGPGVLTLDSGEQVAVDCYHLRLNGPPD